MRRFRSLSMIVGLAGLVLAACGDDDGVSAEGADGGERPTIVVTTNILGDVVEQVVGDQAEVVTVMPVGADPHNFQASAQQAAQMRDADVLVVNGGGFEQGLLDVIDAAIDDGAVTFEAMSAVDPLEYGATAHDHSEHEHADEEHADEGDHAEDEHADEHDHAEEEHADEHDHADEEHADEHDHAEDEHADEDEGHDHDHDHEGDDPHFFTDPVRMATVVESMTDFLADNVEGLDVDALRSSADDYVAELDALDAEVSELVGQVPEDGRILVTNHEVFGYFAERYGFEIVGTVIPSGSTGDGASAGALAELAEIVAQEGVAAIFADASSSNDLTDTLAEEAGGVEVVELFSESLGESDSEGATYLDMVRTNAQRIVAGLTG